MADSFTTNFNFDQPQVDASTNTWGTKTNLNWSSLDAILTNIAGTNIGSSRPSPAFTGMFWINNTFPSTTQWTLYIYDGVDDVTVGVINTVNNVFVPVNGAVGTTAVYFAQDTSITPNTITASISTTPYPPIQIGLVVIVKVANANTGATVISLDGSTPISVVRSNSASLQPNDLVAGQTAILIYDGSHFQYFPPSPRATLIANATYYVNTGTGNDSTGNGSVSQPWATIQHAVNFVQQKLDLGGYNVTISVTISGTYTQNTSVTGPFVGVTSLNSIAIVGNPTNPSTCPITVAGNDCFTGGYYAFFSIVGFQLSTTGTGYAINSNTGSVILFQNMIFGACASGHIIANGCSAAFANSNYTITGSAPFHWCAEVNGLLDCYGHTITITGTPAFSTAFATCSGSGTMTIYGNTFTGSVTGQRYLVTSNGIINTNSAGETYLPGNVAGTQSTGGRYDSDALGLADGGTGATSASTARTNLGLGTAAVANQSSATGTVAAVTGTITAGHVAVFNNTAGTIQDGGAPGTGTVTSVATGTGLTGGTITTSGTISLASIAAHSLLANTTGSSAAPTAVLTKTFIQSVNIQTFTASGTYTPTTGMVECIIEAIGGGGGGGGCSSGSSYSCGAGGGGSGGYSRTLASAATVGSSQTVTIGAGGAGGSGAGVNGNNGGTTSVGTICIANGGGGGTYGGAGYVVPGNGGAGGAAGTGTVTACGGPGASGNGGPNSCILSAGIGGSSAFGGGGVASIVNGAATAGGAAINYGSGGGGASAQGTTSAAAGGNGSAGIVIITEFVAV